VQNTTIVSDQAGRDGADIKQLLIKMGILPANATDQDVIDYMRGVDGTDGITPVPVRAEDIFNLTTE